MAFVLPCQRSSLAIAAAVAIGIVVGVIGFMTAQGAGADEPGAASAVLVVDGDGCHLVPTSCLGPSAATTAWVAPAGSISIAHPTVLDAVDTVDGTSPLEAFVLVHTPPPQNA